MRVGIGVQVSTIDGARTGATALLELFESYDIRVTFFVSLGPDRTGSLWRRVAGAPFVSDLAHEELMLLADSSHELGLAPFDPEAWREEAAHADLAWTRRQVEPAAELYERLFEARPECFGALDYQINPHLLEVQERIGLGFASDVQGRNIFLPRAQRVDGAVPQIPVTLPDVVTALNTRGVGPENVHEHLFDLSQELAPTGHVWRIHAEEEGMEYLDVVEKMLMMWRGSYREIGPLGVLLHTTDMLMANRLLRVCISIACR
jgi:hypothetical protein